MPEDSGDLSFDSLMQKERIHGTMLLTKLQLDRRRDMSRFKNTLEWSFRCIMFFDDT